MTEITIQGRVHQDAIRSIAEGFLRDDPAFPERMLAQGALELLEDLREEKSARQIADEGNFRVVEAATARNIVNQIADFYMARIPSEQWVEVRQATNDKLDEWVQDLLASKVLDYDSFGIDECRGDGSCPAPKHVHGCYREHKASECLDEAGAPVDWHLPKDEEPANV